MDIDRKIKSKTQEEIPDTLFVVLHENGNVIFTYPSLGGRTHIVSSLVSAIFALGEEITGTMTEVVHTTLEDQEFFFIKKTQIIYSLFISKELGRNQNFEKLLLKLVEVVKNDFPADIEGGLLHVKTRPKELENKIEATIERFMSADPYDIKRKIDESLPFSDVIQIFGKEKLVKVFRGLLAEKNVVIQGYDPTLLLKILNSISSFWTENLPVVFEYDLDKIIEEKTALIATIGEREDKIQEKLENPIYIDLDSSNTKKLKEKFLFEKLADILDLESEESKTAMLKNEILSLETIVSDVKKLLNETEEATRLETIRQKLSNKHPKKKVKYILDVLINEESPIAEKIRTPFDQLF